VRARGFSTRRDDLPATLPVFPLPGVLLLPGGRLPLNIFEPRYLAMFDDALASNRLIGMIQPNSGQEQAAVPDLYPTGCAGRIVQFSETEDGRYLVTLLGVARFDASSEVESMRGYRRVIPNWDTFRQDLDGGGNAEIDRDRLTSALRGYFEHRGIKADWDAIERTDDAQLVTTMAMLCPFDPTEKQALLVANDPVDRAETMIALMEMALHPTDGTDNARH
jgi:Lon protease-like protein